MGEVATTNSGGQLSHLTQKEMQNAFLQAGDELDAGGGSAYGKFSGNTGEFTYGQNDEEVEPGETVVFDMQTAFRGWTCWLDAKVEEEIIVRVIDGNPPRESQLPDHGPYDDDDGWGPLCGVGSFLMDGTPVLWKFTSKSAASAFGKLLTDYGRNFLKHPGKMPVVEFDANEFEPKKKSYGKKWAPVFTIVDWIDPDELSSSAVGEDEGDYETSEAPTEEADEDGAIPTNEKVEARTAGKSEETPAEEAPQRGRRRRRSV